jgi:5-methylthioadenosine/S-adenosylhomocysteine deaminase
MTPASTDHLVSDVTIAVPSAGWRPFTGWLACHDTRIVAIGRDGEAAPCAGRVIDGQGGLLLPGLRNARTHGSEILAHGAADGRDLAAVWPRLDALRPELMAVAICFGALPSIRCGGS